MSEIVSSKSEPQVFTMEGGFLFGMIFIIGFTCCFIPWVAWQLYVENPGFVSEILIGVVTASLSLIGLAYSFHLFKVRKSRIELTGEGITRIEASGSKVFIHWDEIGRLAERRQMQQLALFDKSKKQRLLIDYQFKDYDKLRERLFEEYEKRLVIPPLPFSVGKLSLHVNPSLLMLLVAFIMVDIRLWTYLPDYFPLFAAPWIIVALFVWLYFVEEYHYIHQIIINSENIEMKTLKNKSIIPWSEVKSVDWVYLSNQSGNQYSLVFVVTPEKKYPLVYKVGSLPEIYLTLKKTLGK